jgi:Trm5-related predicted tRNA methylase
LTQRALTDKTKKPGDQDLTEVLGETKQLWDQLKAHIKTIFPDINEDWKHYGKKSGWTMKLLHKKRNLFFSSPYYGYFIVSFVFGDKAVQAVENSALPRNIINTLKEAQKYMEGRGLQIVVKNQEDLQLVKQLLAIKIEN